MNTLLTLPVAVCLLAAGVSLAVHRVLWLQRAISLLAVGTAVVDAALLLARVSSDGPAATALGGWSHLIGIVYAADLLTALLLLVALVTVFAVLLYAIGDRGTDEASVFHPVFLVLAAGVSASFLTADLFHLFVAFEVMLVASYVLITLGGRAPQVRSGMTYVVINVVASTLLLITIGIVYAATGTVNMAELAGRMAELDPALRQGLTLMLLVVFGTKAAIFPLYFWLPDSYPTAPTAITAVFAGLLTKVGVYTILRSQTLFDPATSASPMLLTVAAVTTVVGVLGAIAQDEMKRILSFHIVSQIGYMVFGLALWTVSGLAGAIFFVVHQIPVKTALFLATGIVEHRTGTSSVYHLGGMIRRFPLAAGCFAVAALSLAGIPPTSGFVGKLALLQAGFAADAWVPTTVALLASILTLFSMTKIWAGVFWGEVEHPEPLLDRSHRTMAAATVGLVAVTVAIAVFAAPIWDWSLRAAEGLLDPSAYVAAVRGGS